MQLAILMWHLIIQPRIPLKLLEKYNDIVHQVKMIRESPSILSYSNGIRRKWRPSLQASTLLFPWRPSFHRRGKCSNAYLTFVARGDGVLRVPDKLPIQKSTSAYLGVNPTTGRIPIIIKAYFKDTDIMRPFCSFREPTLSNYCLASANAL